MKIPQLIRAGFAVVVAASTLITVPSSNAAGIPEPSLTLYGKVFNKFGGNSARLTYGEMRWTFKPLNGGAWVTLTNKLANLNDQFSYVLQVPCESEIVGFAISANTLKVPTAPATVDRGTVAINNLLATFVIPAQTSMAVAANERGRVERVDLEVSIAPVDNDGDGLPDDWEQAFFGSVAPTANGDADGDGASNLAEYQAGTDPTDPNSLFAVIHIGPHPQGGVAIQWSSMADKTYSIQRSGSLLSGFGPIATQLPATPPLNAYRDTTATGVGPYFYRLQLDQ